MSATLPLVPLVFDPDTHIYTDDDGRVVPHVTAILKAAGLIGHYRPMVVDQETGDVIEPGGFVDAGEAWAYVKPAVLKAKRDLGTDVHRAIARGDTEANDPFIQGYLDGWWRFRRETKFVPVCSEFRVYHPTRGYAGTVDHFGVVLNGTRSVLVDVKLGPPEDVSAEVQTAAYEQALLASASRDWLPNDVTLRLEEGGLVLERWCLHLNGMGGYRLLRYTSRRDWLTFCAALTIYAHKQERTHR